MATVGDQVTIDRLRELVATTLAVGIEQVAEDALLYEDLEVDSLYKTEILARVEREFHVRIEPEDWAAVRTISGVAALVRDKLVASEEGAARAGQVGADADGHRDTQTGDRRRSAVRADVPSSATACGDKPAISTRMGGKLQEGLPSSGGEQ